MGTIALQALGCKLNQAETEALARQFLEAGYRVVAPDQGADIYLLNTCTVTHIADRKCRSMLRSAHRRNPDALIVATGCYVERAAAELSSIEGVGLVAGNADKGRLVEIIESRYNGHRCSALQGHQVSPFRTRAMVKIQEGCSQSCSFCVVPRVRGGEQSRPPEEIVSEVEARVSEGYKEVVLTGTCIGRYGEGGGLRALVERILRESGILRLRLSSLEPCDLTPELFELWKDSRLCPHIHMPLQSGSDSVLGRMGRTYSTSEYGRAASLAREAIPNLALTTDIVVGFPGENEGEFRESYRFCEGMKFAGMHVFPFSARPGTRAAKMPDRVGANEKKERCQLMLDLAQKSKQCFREGFLGQSMSVLWEGEREGIWYGLTDNYMRVFAASKETLANRILPMKMVAQYDGILLGEVDNRKGVRL